MVRLGGLVAGVRTAVATKILVIAKYPSVLVRTNRLEDSAVLPGRDENSARDAFRRGAL